MNFSFHIFSAAFQHRLPAASSFPQEEISSLKVFKNEAFGIQLLLRAEGEFLLSAGKQTDISYKGLIDSVRLHLRAEDEEGREVSGFFSLSLMDFIKDDEGHLVSDLLSESPALLCSHGEQAVFIEGKFPVDLQGKQILLTLSAFFSKGYQEERLIFEKSLPVEVFDFVLSDIRDSDFYTDLWQHPCNWARAYDLPFYGEEHLRLIDRYFEQLGQIGQRVCDLIVSDFPWAGQRCYKVEENHNNLFESNIIGISKDADGKLRCDFSAMDEYINLAQKHKMADEINLFGLLGNWDAYDFGNPLTDFQDPIRLRFFDEMKGVYSYLRTREELLEYLRLLFAHLDELGLWERTMILSDEPSNVKLFEESVRLFEEAAQGREIRLKCAIHDQNFFENYRRHIRSLSLNTCELIHNFSGIEALREKIEANGGTLTWYSCCFPTPMNIFFKSPLIESRLIGWFTYYMGMHGFLRWAYGVWPGKVFESASYKKEKWAAGDMFFVYPGRSGAPLPSIRLKNLIYGLQDYIFLREAEKILSKEQITEALQAVLGKKEEMRFVPDREILLHHSLDPADYLLCKEQLWSKMREHLAHLEKIAESVVEMDEEGIISRIEDALDCGVSSSAIYERGLSEGMLRVTKLFENKEYFVSEVIVCADTLNKGIGHLKQKAPIFSNKGPKIILGVVEGDLHEIGKNIVKIMFEAAGFDVIDMGLNVKAEDIVRRALEEKADIIGLSTMMTTTMVKMRRVIELLRLETSGRLPKVIIGGGCISSSYSLEIGADGYSANAVEAVKLVRDLMGGAKQ